MRRCWTRWRRVEGRGDKFLICLHCDQFWLWNKNSGLKQTHTALRAETYQDINTRASYVCCFGVSRWACESNTVIFESTSCIQIGAVCISVGGRLLCEADKAHMTHIQVDSASVCRVLFTSAAHLREKSLERCELPNTNTSIYDLHKEETGELKFSVELKGESFHRLRTAPASVTLCLSIRLNKTGLSLSTLIWTVPI